MQDVGNDQFVSGFVDGVIDPITVFSGDNLAHAVGGLQAAHTRMPGEMHDGGGDRVAHVQRALRATRREIIGDPFKVGNRVG